VVWASFAVLAASTALVALLGGTGLAAGAGRVLQLDLPTAALVAGGILVGLLAWQLVLLETTRGLGEEEDRRGLESLHWRNLGFRAIKADVYFYCMLLQHPPVA